ncbi:hypothetical protein PBN151_3547 [Paenibacillus sp. NAIST15-1]|nr:hypothetical protein PBN151_3547 [Paenibacillus sp. NAIST15-1]
MIVKGYTGTIGYIQTLLDNEMRGSFVIHAYRLRTTPCKVYIMDMNGSLCGVTSLNRSLSF